MTEQTVNIVVLITSISMEEAQKIAGLLLSERKIACVNIVKEVVSMFWWKNKIEETRETLLIIKTNSSLLDDIVAMVKKVHSYEVPEVIALPIVGGSSDYLKWINDEVGEQKPAS
ncbi:MAG: cytochrome C biogenesis protein CcdA [Chloroflexi bacterium RBG_16_48_7]|nr:MAG: cytochrome C biogenesis protein CcdA [Chloroflexi bacterium RBG_16_48_7]